MPLSAVIAAKEVERGKCRIILSTEFWRLSSLCSLVTVRPIKDSFIVQYGPDRLYVDEGPFRAARAPVKAHNSLQKVQSRNAFVVEFG